MRKIQQTHQTVNRGTHVKNLRRAIFSALSRMEGIIPKIELKNNNSLKELKGTIAVAYARMFEVCGKRIGRRANFAAIDLDQYKNIAYQVAHQYKNKLVVFDAFEKQIVLKEMIDAGMEGISQGLSRYDPTRSTKMSTFLFNRAKYAISKFYQKLIRENKRAIISLNAETENGETEYQDIVNIETPDIFDSITKNVQYSALISDVDSLTEREQTILKLCSESTPNKAAKQANVSFKTVKNLLDSVKEKLATEVQNWYTSN